jgi:subtilase family serine protease
VGATTTRFFLSTDTTLDPADIVLGSRAVPALEPSVVSIGTNALTIPGGLGGVYYLIALADADNAIIDPDRTNNTSAPMALVVGTDLVAWVELPSGSSRAAPGGTITVTDHTRNESAVPAPASTTTLYLSQDTTLDAGDTVLGTRAVPALAATTTNSGSTNVTLPTTLAGGTYYVIGKADGPGAIAETNENNNAFGAPRAVLVGADLIVGLDVPASAGSVASGATFTLTDVTRNSSPVPAVASTTRFYASSDTVLDAADLEIGNRAVPLLAPFTEHSAQTAVTLPAGIAGTFYVIAQADGHNVVAEVDKTNNTAVSVALQVGTDLIAWVELPAGSGLSTPGGTITITDFTRNESVAPAPASTTTLYLSTDQALDAADVVLGTRAVPALAPGATDSGSTSVTLPATLAAGTYYVIGKADGPGVIAESNETNNAFGTPRALLIGANMMIALDVPSSSATLPPGASFTVLDITRNDGPAPAVASTTRFYLSTDPVLDAADVVLASRPVPALAPRTEQSAQTTLTIPTGQVGVFYVIAKTDADDVVTEVDETNNTAVSLPITVGTDLVAWVELPAGSSRAAPGGTITVTDFTRNESVAPAPASTTTLYLSTDQVLDAADVVLGTRAVPALAPGATDSGSTTVTVPATLAAGTYYVIGKADGPGVITESNEANNAFGTPRAVLVGADLIVAIDVPGSAWAAEPGATITVMDVTRNSSPVPAAASTTRFYLSSDSVLDAGDVLLGARAVPLLAPFTEHSAQTAVTLPAGVGGVFHVIAQANGDGVVAEVDTTNNTAASATPIQIGSDLVVGLDIPSSGFFPAAGATIVVTDLTRNNGGVAAPPITVRFYLSADPVLDAGDAVIGSRVVPALASHTESLGQTAVTLPANLGGTFYLIARADADNAAVEVNELNNLAVSRALSVGTDLVVSLDVPSGSLQAAPGATISVTDVTRNGSTASAPASVTRFHLSADSVLDASDLVLGSRAVPALAPSTESTGITSLTLPAGLIGPHYLIARADADDAVVEVNETNNVFVFSQPIIIGSDLTVTLDLAGASAAVPAGATITLADFTKNSGPGRTNASMMLFYVSADTVLDAGDMLLGSRAVPPLESGEVSSATNLLTLPTGIAGYYYVLAQADGGGVVPELNESNNVTASTPIEVGPDLTITGLSAPAMVGSGTTVYISDTTKNRGAGSAGASTTRIFLSTDEVLDAGDLELGARAVQDLAPLAYHSGTTAVVIPSLPAGRYWLMAVADGLEQVTESNEGNNAWVQALDVLPDLTVPTITAPSKAYPGSVITVGDSTVNSGAAAPASTTGIFLSTNTSLDAGDLLLGVREVPALGTGATNAGQVPVALPIELAAGTYYLIAIADAAGAVDEVNEGNNTRYKSLTIGPDLTVPQLTVPSSAAVGATIIVSETTKNLGSAAPVTTTRYYLSTDTTVGAGDVLLGSRMVPSLAVNETSAESVGLTIPGTTAPGTYYVIAQSDGDGAVIELVETNNLKSRAISITP